MDNLPDLSSLMNSNSGIGDAVGKLLSRPDLIANIASELGLSQTNEHGESDIQKVPEVKKENSKPNDVGDNKKRLLLALRPYMSEKRKEALDMMINLEAIGKTVKNIDPNLLMSLLGGNKNV